MEANLGMVIGEGISEKVIFKRGSNVRREPASERRPSRGEGTASVKVLHRNKVGMFGEWKEAQCVRAQWVRDRQVYAGGWKGGHG